MPLYITQLILPKKQNPTAFVDYMTKDFINEIHPSPRIGAIGKLTLLQNGLMTDKHVFMLLSEWSGIASNPCDFLFEDNHFKKFKVKVIPVGPFENVSIS